MGLGLFIGVWIARYLGPEQFGLISFATAFVGLFVPMATLGLQGIVVRDIARNRDCACETLGTAAILQLIGSLIAYLFLLLVIAYLRPEETLTRSVVVILGLMLLLKLSDIAVFWFESQVQSKYIVWVQNSVVFVFAAFKVVLILQKESLIAFAWVMLAEAFVMAFVMLVIMNKRGLLLKRLYISVERAKSLLTDSWPLIIGAIAIMMYMKIDQIMLGQMMGDDAVGIYSAAVRISEVWYFIPMAITASVFPAILEAKKINEEKYYGRLQKLFDLMVLISVSVAVLMTFLSTPIITLLYGDAYVASGPVLSIHIWASIFVFLGVAASRWFLAENKQTLSLQRSVLGAVLNILLNLILIPHHGLIGAAVATIISHCFAVFFLDFMQVETRTMFYMKMNSINIFSSFARLINFRGDK